MKDSKTKGVVRKLTLATTTAVMAMGLIGSMTTHAQTGGTGGYNKVTKSQLDNGTLVIVCEGSGTLECK